MYCFPAGHKEEYEYGFSIQATFEENPSVVLAHSPSNDFKVRPSLPTLLHSLFTSCYTCVPLLLLKEDSCKQGEGESHGTEEGA